MKETETENKGWRNIFLSDGWGGTDPDRKGEEIPYYYTNRRGGGYEYNKVGNKNDDGNLYGRNNFERPRREEDNKEEYEKLAETATEACGKHGGGNSSRVN